MNQVKTGCIAIGIALSIFSFNSVNAKPAYPGDVLGRNLDYPGLGPLGHVGIATGDNLGTKAWVVIEALKAKPVIQINDIFFFKAKSPYWGSRYGIGDYSHGTNAALVEANHQRWWCPTYTDSTAYTIYDFHDKKI